MANWYIYSGFGSFIEPVNYLKSTVKPSCLTGRIICAIYLEDSTTTPTTPFNQDRLDYIVAALATNAPQPTAGTKRFVYMKS